MENNMVLKKIVNMNLKKPFFKSNLLKCEGGAGG